MDNSMSKWLEYSLLGLGVLMLIASFTLFIFGPIALLGFFCWKVLVPIWTPMHTFGAIVVLGIASTGYLISCIGGNRNE